VLGLAMASMPPRLEPTGITALTPALSVEVGRGSSSVFMKSTHWCARNADQNAHAFRDRPLEIRVTHPPHPLFGQTLEVVQHRRAGGQTSWIALLPDGSRIGLPSYWTDHPVGRAPVPRMRSGGRATPEALRELAALLDALASKPQLRMLAPVIP